MGDTYPEDLGRNLCLRKASLQGSQGLLVPKSGSSRNCVNI